MVIHGWPGSFVEFHKIIEPLNDPAAHGGDPGRRLPPGHPVAARVRLLRPAGEAGYGPARMAEVFVKLMARLGYTRYGLQGGDYGSLISRIMGGLDPQHVAGIHLNLCSSDRRRTSRTRPPAYRRRSWR